MKLNIEVTSIGKVRNGCGTANCGERQVEMKYRECEVHVKVVRGRWACCARDEGRYWMKEKKSEKDRGNCSAGGIVCCTSCEKEMKKKGG